MVSLHSIFRKTTFFYKHPNSNPNLVLNFQPKAKNAKKKFIDKKKSVTFNLVHRSQRDPLIADETAPQRVLVPVNAVVPPRKEKDPVSQNAYLGTVDCTSIHTFRLKVARNVTE